MSDSSDRGKTLELIRELIELPLPGKWSVKDSFFNLELATLGFDLLFDASWIWCDPIRKDSDRSSSGIHWSRITSPAELALWEASWSGNLRNRDAINEPVQFPSSLLEDRQINFFAGSLRHEVIAGGIANRTSGVTGLSNVFVNTGDATAAWLGLINCVQDAFPALPLVGYERDIALKCALACGFKTIGSLRVWTHRN